MDNEKTKWRVLRQEYVKEGLYTIRWRMNAEGVKVQVPTRFKRWYLRNHKG